MTGWLRESERSLLKELPQIAAIPGISPEGMLGLTRLAGDLEGIPATATAWEFLSSYMLGRSNHVREMAARESVKDRLRAIAVWQFLNFVREQKAPRAGLPIQRVLSRVRQLVLLAEERELRQVPAAALGMNAVRLMTVHGSKGLEFEAVHVPGLTIASFPSSNRGQRCPPPVGMIEGAENLTVREEAKRAHEQEEECLFFVAASRAHTHLCLHLARRQPNGNNRKPSSFLDWIGGHLSEEIAQPTTLPLPPDAPRPIPIAVNRPPEWLLTASRFKAYEQCPRRFFYTHVLGLGTARQETAFSRTHNCLYEFVDWLADARCGAEPSLDDAEAAFEGIWQATGPVDHGFAVDYRRLASGLVSALVRAGAGRRFRNAEPLAIDFQNGRVIVEPDEIAESPDGVVVLRRIRTGRKHTDEYDGLEYTLYHLAGQAQFGGGFVVEAHHLTDDRIEEVQITAQKMKNRAAKSNDMLGRISSGWFPPERNAMICPRCPHFFICAATPSGSLTLKDQI